MDRASQPARTGLTDRLAPDIARINFYRFCQLLEQSQQNAPLGSTDSPATDAVRFRPHPGMGFPVSELKNVERDAGNPDAPPTVRTTFLGLYGVDSPLPTAYLDYITQRHDGHDAVMAFLDIFNHRFITQYYRIWRKYNYPASFEAGAVDDISRCLLGLIGLGIPGSENHIATPVSRFLALLSVGKHAKQSGGRGQYGHVVIDMYPLEPGSNPKGYEFINDIKGGVIPGEYIPAVDKGIQEQLKAGPLAGYPVVDMGIRLHFGSYHDVDSSELAFKLAASIAFKEGFKKAKPVLLEPIMKVEVETPEENTGDVIGDLSRRRGMLRGQESEVTGVKIHAEVPLSEMFGYATQLRSLTKGRASYTMEFLKYDDAPNNVAQAVIEARGK